MLERIINEKLFRTTEKRAVADDSRQEVCKVLEQNLFTEMIRKWKDSVFRLAYSYMKSQADADDITQTVFLKLLRSDTAFSSEEHVRNWLMKVTANECRSLLRSWWRRMEDIEQYAEQLAMEPEQKKLLTDVMKLPEKYRIPIYLHYYEDYSSEEIGQILHMPVATVRTRLARGRKQLRILLEGADCYE